MIGRKLEIYQIDFTPKEIEMLHTILELVPSEGWRDEVKEFLYRFDSLIAVYYKEVIGT